MRVIITDISDGTNLVANVLEAFVCDYIDVDTEVGKATATCSDDNAVLSFGCASDTSISVVMPKRFANNYLSDLYVSGRIDLRDYSDVTFYDANADDLDRLSSLGFNIQYD